MEKNEVYLNTWVLPRWGTQPLDTLLGVHVEEWLANLDFAAGTKAKMRNLMSAVYSHAIRHGWIKHNPIESVRQSAKRKRIPDVLDAPELLALMSHLSLMNRTLVVLAMFLGPRASELLALKWSDFDFLKMELWIRRSVYHQQINENCKTEASQRPLPIDAFIAETVRAWKRQSTYAQPGDWVFASTQRKGKQPYWPENRRKAIRKAAEAAGIKKRVGFHTFRHTLSCLLKDNGEDVKVVQELLRHANSPITLDTYTQAAVRAKRAAQERVIRLVLGESYNQLQSAGSA